MPKPVQPPADEQEAEQRRISKQLGEIIDRLGAERGLTIEKVAGKSGLTLYKLHAIKNRHSDPPLTTLLKLCGGLKVTPGTLLDELPIPEAREPGGRDHAAR